MGILSKGRVLFFCVTLMVVALVTLAKSTFAQNPSHEVYKVYLPVVQNPESADNLANDHGDRYWAGLAEEYEAFEVDPDALRVAGPDELRELGEWGDVLSWPHIAVSGANLPDGRILTWASNAPDAFPSGQAEFTYAASWDPTTSQFQEINNNGHDMFCSHNVMLPDGRIFVNGGRNTVKLTTVFNALNNSWSQVEGMNDGRWYPTTVALPTGQVFTASGRGGPNTAEVWTPDQGWQRLSGIDWSPIANADGFESLWWPYLFVAPSGQLFHAGPTDTMHWVDTRGAGSLTPAGVSVPGSWYPKHAGVAMYDEGKILVAGGAADTDGGSTNEAYTVDISDASPQVKQISPMKHPRRFSNAMMLPNGEVLVIGGNSSGTKFSDEGTILTPEIWNPQTEQWREVADMAVPRNYHSVAFLLADGRILSAGGGLCGSCAANHQDAQIYSPFYLFNADGSLATRPQISSAPTNAETSQTIRVNGSSNIQRFSLIKMSSTTHGLSTDMRYLNVPFSEVSRGEYQLTLHGNLNVLTPGYWMLFALNQQGVPSVAKTIKVSPASDIAPEVSHPGAQSHAQGENVNLAIQGSHPSGKILTYSANALPSGLSINANSGRITGILSAAGTYNVTVTVSDGNNSAETTFEWTVYPAGTDLYQYVCLVAESEVNGTPWASMAEFNLLDGQGNRINRSAWSIKADSEETQAQNGRAINAIDGDINTIWHSQWLARGEEDNLPSHPHGIAVDLGVGHELGGFSYLPRQDSSLNGRVEDYKFYISQNGVNWIGPVAQGSFANDNSEKTVTFTPPPPDNNCGGSTQEAEEGALSGNFVIGNDGQASGGQYIHTPDGSPSNYSGPDSAHQAEYCFQVDTAGTYRLKGVVYAESSQNNSFFAQVNGSPANGYLWYIPTEGDYTEAYLTDRGETDPVEFNLATGQHTITIHLREAGARLDKLELELAR